MFRVDIQREDATTLTITHTKCLTRDRAGVTEAVAVVAAEGAGGVAEEEEELVTLREEAEEEAGGTRATSEVVEGNR